jgi:2-polyprenyl-3-methyl-5-hydroxy-6-metoxy-1,4-benzoquinol methylase
MNKIKRRIKQLLSLLIGLMRFPFCSSQYDIKRGYRHRKQYAHFSAIGAKDEMQNEVYETAYGLAEEHGLQNIIDVGCGAGYKLIKFFSKEYDFIGIDIQTTYEYLVKQYPAYHWVNGETLDYSELTGDLVICADVIEHVIDPIDLLQKIKSIKNVKFIILSTPDRLLVRGSYDFGPPGNWSHMREWTGKEFANFIRPHLNILTHQISNYSQGTQLLVCKPYL